MNNNEASNSPDLTGFSGCSAWFLYGASCEERFAFAQLLHRYDNDARGPFVIATSAAVPRVFQEEAFFGPQEHSWVNQAEGGMLVIGEIDSLVPAVQEQFAQRLQSDSLPLHLVMTSGYDKKLLLEQHALEEGLHNWLARLDERYCADAERIRAAQYMPSGTLSGFSALIEPLLRDHVKSWLEAEIGGLHSHIIAEIERPLIRMTLNYTRGNQIRAAALLGLNRNTLRKKIRELHITVSRGHKVGGTQ